MDSRKDPIRVLLVDDSRLARKHIVGWLQKVEDIEVVGEASTGEEALAQAVVLRPDVVLLDVVLPDMAGEQVAKRLTRELGMPVVAITSLDDPDVHENIRQAGAHAVWVKKGFAPECMDALTQLVREAAAQSPHRKLKGRELPRFRPPFPLVAIAASTGGPPIVRNLLSALPPTFPAPVVVIQHMMEGIIPQTRLWLQEVCPLPVRVAAHNLPIEAGVVYLAPDNEQLRVQFPYFKLGPSLGREGPRPSADEFLESAVASFGPWVVAVILSGMGKDGAKGAARVAEAGGFVLVQDPEEAVLPSMPGAVLAQGIPCRVLRSAEIPAHLVLIVSHMIQQLGLLTNDSGPDRGGGNCPKPYSTTDGDG